MKPTNNYPEMAEESIKIFTAYLSRMRKVEDETFDKLVSDLNFNQKGEDWLFDYVYNTDTKYEDRDTNFAEFVGNVGLRYADLVKHP